MLRRIWIGTAAIWMMLSIFEAEDTANPAYYVLATLLFVAMCAVIFWPDVDDNA